MKNTPLVMSAARGTRPHTPLAPLPHQGAGVGSAFPKGVSMRFHFVVFAVVTSTEQQNSLSVEVSVLAPCSGKDGQFQERSWTGGGNEATWVSQVRAEEDEESERL